MFHAHQIFVNFAIAAQSEIKYLQKFSLPIKGLAQHWENAKLKCSKFYTFPNRVL